jgi:hypothetical protein
LPACDNLFEQPDLVVLRATIGLVGLVYLCETKRVMPAASLARISALLPAAGA